MPKYSTSTSSEDRLLEDQDPNGPRNGSSDGSLASSSLGFQFDSGSSSAGLEMAPLSSDDDNRELVKPNTSSDEYVTPDTGSISSASTTPLATPETIPSSGYRTTVSVSSSVSDTSSGGKAKAEAKSAEDGDWRADGGGPPIKSRPLTSGEASGMGHYSEGDESGDIDGEMHDDMATNLRSSPAPTFMVNRQLQIVTWSVGMIDVSSVDPNPRTPVSDLPFASVEARNLFLKFLSKASSSHHSNSAESVELRVWCAALQRDDEVAGGARDSTCLMHMRPSGAPEEVLLSIAVVTKSARGDLVLVGSTMDPRLAGLYGKPSSRNDETISDISSVTYLPAETGADNEDHSYPPRD